MGREIRRVPPNWEHPKAENGNYMVMHDHDFDTAFQEWIAGYELWKKGGHPEQLDDPERYTDCEYWEWEGNPPNPDYCRPAFKEEPTWYQVYETVSEGTPVTPPFETKEELVDYLVEHGTFWDVRRVQDGRQPVAGWPQEAAEKFVENEWAPSFMMTIDEGKMDLKSARDGI